jgi:hypothetical protein
MIVIVLLLADSRKNAHGAPRVSCAPDVDDRALNKSTGGCLCGAVRYRAHAELREVINCHCGRCRRTHGHVAAYTQLASANLELLEDRGLRWYLADDRERGFCGDCGASLFWREAGGATVSVAAGTLDEPTGLRTVAHIYVASKGDYYEIGDTLERHAASQHAESD